MPNRFEFRPLNVKIVKYNGLRRYIDVYSTTNGSKKQFASIRRMFAYHSPNTVFIDYDSSKLVNKGNSLTTNMIYVDEILVTYKFYTNNGIVYKKLNGTPCSISEIGSSNTKCLDISLFRHVIFERIQNSIRGVAAPMTSNMITPDELQRALNTASNTIASEQEEINHNLIYSYHSGPRALNMRRSDNDDNTNNLYFGIELEFDASRDRNPSTRKQDLLATRLNKILNNNDYNSLVKFERDGSLGTNGIEMITQPMTMRFLLENKDKFKEAMKEIDNLNYSSHDSGRCGMHIHVSRNALSESIIDNLYLIFENFKNEIVAFSRRTQSGMGWCRFMSDNHMQENFSEEFIKSHKPYGNDHHSAINNGNSNTVEFRIFRGTTKIRTFIANVQLIDNMITLAKKEDITGITWEQIINVNPEYTELKEYNEKRSIISKHQLTKNISRMEVIQRPVILVRPFQVTLEGDN